MLAVNVTCVPAHMLPEVVAIVGLGIALSVNVALLEQVPFAPITVPVAIGLPLDVPTICEPFNVFVVKPIIGPHVNVIAPLAVRLTVFGEPLKLFIQSVGLLGTILIVGSGNTLTVIVARLVHVFCDPRIEYVVVTVGLAVVLAVFVLVSATFGVHV